MLFLPIPNPKSQLKLCLSFINEKVISFTCLFYLLFPIPKFQTKFFKKKKQKGKEKIKEEFS